MHQNIRKKCRMVFKLSESTQLVGRTSPRSINAVREVKADLGEFQGSDLDLEYRFRKADGFGIYSERVSFTSDGV